MRNTDFRPTRLFAQKTAVQFILDTMRTKNAENQQGLVKCSHGGQAIVSLTSTPNILHHALDDLTLGEGESFLRSLAVAHLVFKTGKVDRRGTDHIIAFIAHPMTESEEDCQKYGEMLRKSNISLAVFSFGSVQENSAKLHALVAAACGGDTTTLVECQPDHGTLEQHVMRSPFIGLGGSSPLEGNPMLQIDDNVEDPELAWALKESRNQMQPAGEGGQIDEIDADQTYDDMLLAAMQMSMQDEQERQSRMQNEQRGATEPATDAQPSSEAHNEAAPDEEDYSRFLDDPDFVADAMRDAQRNRPSGKKDDKEKKD
ncbi:putative 26S proteasome regulatory subunit RPN10 [Blattamonas nauphoetae]|uniref:26S proteasome regulatory subunit RPN10 n=1 Tax=Blattamonas nauphoetae TaxID=2049346 RepID=A0ABQ9YEZ4_9EUKA|nr:putative 26S proteasome regulatory subunit RPN10 [Blattamonas nauphoetae]